MTIITAATQTHLFPLDQLTDGTNSRVVYNEEFTTVSAQGYNPITGRKSYTRGYLDKWIIIQTAFDADGNPTLFLHLKPQARVISRRKVSGATQRIVSGLELENNAQALELIGKVSMPFPLEHFKRVIVVSSLSMSAAAAEIARAEQRRSPPARPTKRRPSRSSAPRTRAGLLL